MLLLLRGQFDLRHTGDLGAKDEDATSGRRVASKKLGRSRSAPNQDLRVVWIFVTKFFFVVFFWCSFVRKARTLLFVFCAFCWFGKIAFCLRFGFGIFESLLVVCLLVLG